VVWLIDSPHKKLLSRSLAFHSKPENKAVNTVFIYTSGAKTTNLYPSVVVSAANAIENASTSFQKYFLAIYGLLPIYERRQYGKLALANDKNLGCHSPRRIRGASIVSQSGCAEMILCMSENKRSGSF
jgi:hypothetical protein